jgi:glycerol-3-phosphate dehydrogenase
MAERVVDRVCRTLGRSEGTSRTDALPLPGGEQPPAAVLPTAHTLAERLPPGSAERLVRLYGAGCTRLAARVAAERALGEPVPGLPGVLRVEVAHAVDEEMALSLTDVLERRTRALLFDPTQGVDGAPAVAAMLAARLGWDDAHTRGEIAAYRQLADNLRSFP